MRNVFIHLILFTVLKLSGSVAIGQIHPHVHVTNEQGGAVTNATITMQIEPGAVMTGLSDEEHSLAFPHTGDGVYRSRQAAPSGHLYQVTLEVSAPGYIGQSVTLTRSGSVPEEYRITLEAHASDESDPSTRDLQQESQDVTFDFQDDPTPGEGTVVDDPGFQYNPTYTETATISPATEGATLSGRVQANIEGHWNPSFPEGLVFALSPDTAYVLGFSYTSRTPHSGYFRIDGLPMTGDVILVAFMPQVKRLHWMDAVSMDEVVDANKQHDSWSVGTVWAHLRQPAGGSPHDLSEFIPAGGALKGAGYALQLMALAGWVSERAMNSRDYSVIDELSNRLYGYYQDGIEKHIVKADYTVADEQTEHETESPPTVGDTENVYQAADDYNYFIQTIEVDDYSSLPEYVRNQSHSDAQIADWNNIKTLIVSNEARLDHFFESTNIEVNEANSIHVKKNGRLLDRQLNGPYVLSTWVPRYGVHVYDELTDHYGTLLYLASSHNMSGKIQVLLRKPR